MELHIGILLLYKCMKLGIPTATKTFMIQVYILSNMSQSAEKKELKF
jgi:hypothetical protein